MTILLDFETRSRCDLKVHGGRLYAEHPSTSALCAVMWDTDTGDVGLWMPGDPPPFTPDEELGAHNAMGFDRFMARRCGWAEPSRPWIDTSELARRAGLPGALDALGTRWTGKPKDKVASDYTRGLSRVDYIEDACPPLSALITDKKERTRARNRQLREWRKLPAEHRRAVVQRIVVGYCASDVEIMAGGWADLRPFLTEGVFAGWEHDVSMVDRIVNDRGVAFDSDLARRLLACDERNQLREFEAAAKVFGGGWTAQDIATAAGSPVQFVQIVGSENAKAETVEALLRNQDLPAYAHALCRARQALASIAGGKLEAGLAGVSPDERLRDLLRYYGAHTGRWSGRRLQPHNFTRPTEEFAGWKDDEICRASDLAGGSAIDVTSDMLNVLMRATITAAPGNALAVCDFAGVEARALAWCAGDRDAVDVFKAYDAGTGPDPYRVAAATIFAVRASDVTKTQRSAGKVSELACGYQGGPSALERMADAMGVDLAAAGVAPEDVVDGWRELHKPIVRYWAKLHAAFVAAVEGRATDVHPFKFVPGGRDVAIFLPSGRPIVYNAVGVHRGRWPDGRPKLEPYYIGTKSGREHIYGGKIAENVIQAMCRDLMADALIRAEEAGLCPVLHVHDEIVCEVPASAAEEGLAELHQIMTTLPEWAAGFPVGAAGHHGKRYRK